MQNSVLFSLKQEFLQRNLVFVEKNNINLVMCKDQEY